MQFNKNKSVSIHKWYPFVEGYSREFIESVLQELDYVPVCALDPFSGSGTTALELQYKNIKCFSFEVSPFMHLLSKVKLRKDYASHELEGIIDVLRRNLGSLQTNIREVEPIPFGDTLVEKEGLSKWNFNAEVLDGILDIRYEIRKVADTKYQDLLLVALSSILIEVSNVFRNGKCLSYKKGWRNKTLKRDEVHSIFLQKITEIFMPDIISTQKNKSEHRTSNFNLCWHGSALDLIKELPDNSIDLVITSPPYLNSRDYTDIYMLELKVLGLVSNHEDLRSLRKRTLRSHVQIKHGELETLEIPLLESYMSQIAKRDFKMWNTDLLNMIRGYFLDIDTLLDNLHKKMVKGKYAYINVANSAYFGTELKVDEIICKIAEKRAFKLIELRKARSLKTSSQQSSMVNGLRETVIVLQS